MTTLQSGDVYTEKLADAAPAAACSARGERGRSVYRHDELRRLIHPKSVAIVGASIRSGSFGLRTINNLVGFGGTIYPVNGKYAEVGGHRCYASLASLPEVPDCVVIALAQDAVQSAVEECIAAGVGGVIVYASGYAETRRPELVAMQALLAETVRGTSTRLLGPNCLGISNYACGARLMFGRMPAPRSLGPNAIGIIAQSGSVSMSLGQAMERGVAVSHALPVGNAADADIADLISYLVDESTCSAIACIFEGVGDADRLIEAAEMALRKDKPLILYKMAVSAQGAAAALSHTGALAGSTTAYRAALSRAGAVLLDQLDDVVETAVFFAKAGRPTGRGAAVVLSSGGLGVSAADKAEQHGVALPQPTGETLAIVTASVPEFGAARNPCDVTAQALNDQNPLETCAGAFLADPVYSALVIVHPYADEISSVRMPIYTRLGERYGKIICNYWSTEWLEGYGCKELEAEPTIAIFRSLDRCFAALAAWHEREARRLRVSASVERLVGAKEKNDAAALINASANPALAEREAKAALALYAIPVVGEELVTDADAAVRAAAKIGFPVVLKVESPGILHKTEAGVVGLNLRSAEEVALAYAEIMKRATAVVPSSQITGVLVQPMVPAGIEMMLGARIDPQFGPMVLVGLGGILVELMKDTAVEVAPVTQALATEMLHRLKGFAALNGFRGMALVDIDRLSEVIARFSEFVADHAATIAEVDINPLICSGSRIIAVDALIVRAD